MADITKVEPSARIKLTRNGVNLYTQHYAPASQTYTEHAADRLVLATNMTVVEEYVMGGVALAEFLLLETSQAIKVGVENQTVLVDVSKAVMLTGASFSHIYLQNTNTTNTAVVHIVVSD